MRSNKLPIGYWIKKADAVLTKGIDAAQASVNLTRTDWQIINIINERAPLSKPELVAMMEPFANKNEIETIIAKFQSEDIVEENKNLALTEKGQQLHQVCLEKQHAFRQKIMTGIDSSAYDTTVQTLQKIIENGNSGWYK